MEFKIIQIYDTENNQPFIFQDGVYVGVWTDDKISVMLPHTFLTCQLNCNSTYIDQEVLIAVENGFLSIKNTQDLSEI